MEKGTAIKHDLKKSPVTGYWRYARPAVDKDKCIGCGTCVKYCPEAAIDFDKNNKADIDYCFCKGCGVCARECPVKAIKMEKESASIKYQV
jgi:pyruvate ferredoxin oxidoreductase delta subunit